MKTNNVQGKNIAVIIGLYLFAKTILNMVIGGGFYHSIFELVIPIVCFIALFSGLEHLNFAVAVIIAIPVLKNMYYNIIHLPSTLIYLVEAVIDVGAILLLVMKKDIKEHFTNKWSEISTLFK